MLVLAACAVMLRCQVKLVCLPSMRATLSVESEMPRSCGVVQREFGAQGDGESDELKRVLLEGNPYFLGITFFVSILHSVFDMLAFKNDIGFWKGKKNVEGLSVRTVAINCVCQVRVMLVPVVQHVSRLQQISGARCPATSYPQIRTVPSK